MVGLSDENVSETNESDVGACKIMAKFWKPKRIDIEILPLPKDIMDDVKKLQKMIKKARE